MRGGQGGGAGAGGGRGERREGGGGGGRVGWCVEDRGEMVRVVREVGGRAVRMETLRVGSYHRF